MSNSGQTALTDLAAFVPTELRWRLANDGALPSEAFEETGDGALLHIDIGGWGAILADIQRPASSVVASAATWLETLCSALAEYGGDVVELGAEQLAVLWREESLPAAVQRASLAALAVVPWALELASEAQLRLHISATVTCGEVSVFALRDHRGVGYVVLSGDALLERMKATTWARQGDVVLTPAAAGAAQATADGIVLPDGFMRLLALTTQPQIEPLHRPQTHGISCETVRPFARESTGTPSVESFARRDGNAVVLAVRLPALAHGCGLERTQSVFVEVTAIAARVGATVTRLFIDGTGLTVCMVLGQLEKDAARAAASALLACEKYVPAPRGARAPCSFGVAAGASVATNVLGERRAVVRLGGAERLAIALARRADASCLCDGTVRQRADSFATFAEAGRWRVPGSLVEVDLYRPTGRTISPTPTPLPADSKLPWRPHLPIASNVAAIVLVGRESADFSAFQRDLDHVHCGLRTLEPTPQSRLLPLATWRQTFGAAANSLAAKTPDLWLAHVTARLAADRELGPTVIAVRDAQWLDDASWRLLLRVAAGTATTIVAFADPAPAFTCTVSSQDALGLAADDELPKQVAGWLQTSLQTSLQTLPPAASSMDSLRLLDEQAAAALAAGGFADAVALTERGLAHPHSAAQRAEKVRRWLRLGDARVGLGEEADARQAYKAAARSLRRTSNTESGLTAAMKDGMARITGRFRTPWADAENPEERELLDAVLARTTEPRASTTESRAK